MIRREGFLSTFEAAKPVESSLVQRLDPSCKMSIFWRPMPVLRCLWQSWIQFANFYILFCNPVQGGDLAAAQVGQGTGWGAGAAQRLQWVEQNWASRTEANDVSSAMHSPEQLRRRFTLSCHYSSTLRSQISICQFDKDSPNLLVILIVVVIVCSLTSRNQ